MRILTILIFLGISLPGWADLSLPKETSYRSIYRSLSEGNGPRVITPTRPRTVIKRYPWRKKIITTVFWIGEKPTPGNPTPNFKSSWDTRWAINYGGTDYPQKERRSGYRPKGFVPGQNPFYIALPFNDLATAVQTKSVAARVVPWFKERFKRHGKSVLKGQWVAVRKGNRICYAQWEDCGPFVTDDWRYVFGKNRPKSPRAGLDVSPAVRDYLRMGSKGLCDWRFVDINEVPQGPWRVYGANNDFVLARRELPARRKAQYENLLRSRDAWLEKNIRSKMKQPSPSLTADR